MSALAAARPVGVGPNAITQMVAALDDAIGPRSTRELFVAAGIEGHLTDPPQHMVPEHDVSVLHRQLHGRLQAALCERVSHAAGLATGDYLLRRRIPLFAQRLLRALPASWAARVLAQAIRRHAWTFAGSGRLRVELRPHLAFVLEDCPVCRQMRAQAPACHYFAATFERLLRALVDPKLQVTETRCIAAGDSSCRFEARRLPADRGHG